MLEIDVARPFAPLLEPARYKGIWGGRGSGKSQFFAGLLVDLAIRKRGLRAMCCREIQKSLKESAKRLIETKIEEYDVGRLFEVQETQIRTPGNGLIAFTGLQDHTAESIKSYEGFDIAWVEEAQTVSAASLNLLRPTIRKPGSELWFSWNPRKENDPVDMMLRGNELPTGAVVAHSSWKTNPWFPAELEQERLDCLRMQPEQYAHIWDGDYVTVSEGAYYAKCLGEAREAGRIGQVDADPLMEFKSFWDIGTSDATAIWVAQFVGTQVRMLDYYEAVNQPLGTHLAWLRAKGYGECVCYLPHDGAAVDHLTADKFEDHVRAAGFRVHVVKNQGKQAAMKRVEAARRLFPAVWFNEATTVYGRRALGWYHEKKNAFGAGIGPEHDESSHGADAFGLMAIAHEEPRASRAIKYSDKGIY